MKPGRVIIGLPEWNLNGVCTYAANLARGLTERGWDARLLLTEERSPLVHLPAVDLALPPSIRIDRLPLTRHDGWSDAWGGLVRYLEEQAPCVYIPNHDWRGSVVSPRLSDRVAIVGVLHNDTALEYDHAARLGRYWNAIVAVNPTIREKAIVELPVLAPRLVTIPIGVPLPAHAPASCGDAGALRLVYHGSLRRHQKRIFDLLRIAEELDERGIPARLTIIGDGEARADFEAAGRSLIARGLVQMLGALAHDAALAQLELHDVYVLASEYEGMPNALLEAMSRGCVPVVSDIETLATVIENGVNGFRVPVGSTPAFADRIAELSADPARRRAMSAEAYRTVPEGGFGAGTMVQRYEVLFTRVLQDAKQGVFRRARGAMWPPPAVVAGTSILEGRHNDAAKRVSRLPLWPNPSRKPAPAIATGSLRPSPHTLQDHRIVLAATTGRISGVDVFSINLARELQRQGFTVEIVQTAPHEVVPDPLPFPDDIPVHRLPLSKESGWPDRWRAMQGYLEERAPSIYVPNYDLRHSCIAARLSAGVKIVGIAHSDDPQHYEHVLRLGRYWDGIVAVSDLIAREIGALDPTLAARTCTIPYGVRVPDSLPTRASDPLAPIRIVYTGRLARYQKRVLDIPCIADALRARSVASEITVVGNGPDQAAFLGTSAGALARREMRYVGSLPNDQVTKVLLESDVFLLTSSFEGLPVSLLEAMAQGCVPVVTGVRSGIPDILQDGVNGFVVPIGDVDRFADRIQQLASDVALRRRMAAAAHRTVRDGGFRIEDMASRYLAVFGDVVAGGFVRPPGKIPPPPELQGFGARMSGLPLPLRKIAWRLRDGLRKAGL